MEQDVVQFVSERDVRPAVSSVFEEVAAELLRVFPSAVVEHVGATSIPGTMTKGDLDICVLVEQSDFDDADRALGALFERNVGSHKSDSLSSFVDESRTVSVGIQLVVIGGPEDFFVKWRNLLRGSRQLIEKYNALKCLWQGRSHRAYRTAKSEFIERLLATSNPER